MCLLSIHISLIHSTAYTGHVVVYACMYMHICNPITQEVEAGYSEIQFHLWLYSECVARLGYMKY